MVAAGTVTETRPSEVIVAEVMLSKVVLEDVERRTCIAKV
jgi:hypothetical protein